MYVKPLAVIFCGFWDSLFPGDAYLRLTVELGFNRIVVLSRTTNRFLFPSLIWLLRVTTYVSVLDKSVLFLWAKNLDVQQMRTSIPAFGLMYNFFSSNDNGGFFSAFNRAYYARRGLCLYRHLSLSVVCFLSTTVLVLLVD